jgi:hypothetical protein
MKKDFETKFTGWTFIAAVLLLLVGWLLSPHRVGEYLVASDFPAIGEHVWYWIWMFRIYIFGWVAMAVAMFALVMLVAKSSHRVILFPGIGMVVAGTFFIAIGYAFYYNFGAWGVGKTAGKSPEEIQQFMDSILFTNQYVTCFMRFGRIFSGVGLVLLGIGFVKSTLVDAWLGWFTGLLGFAAMAVILFVPEYFESYKPLVHVKVLWLALMGITILRKGVNLEETVS